MDTDSPTAAASDPVVHGWSAVNSSDISFTRAGSASALSRIATSSADASSAGLAAIGAQQTGCDMSITGSVLGMSPSSRGY